MTPQHPKGFPNGAVQPIANGQPPAPMNPGVPSLQPDPLANSFMTDNVSLALSYNILLNVLLINQSRSTSKAWVISMETWAETMFYRTSTSIRSFITMEMPTTPSISILLVSLKGLKLVQGSSRRRSNVITFRRFFEHPHGVPADHILSRRVSLFNAKKTQTFGRIERADRNCFQKISLSYTNPTHHLRWITFIYGFLNAKILCLCFIVATDVLNTCFYLFYLFYLLPRSALGFVGNRRKCWSPGHPPTAHCLLFAI